MGHWCQLQFAKLWTFSIHHSISVVALGNQAVGDHFVRSGWIISFFLTFKNNKLSRGCYCGTAGSVVASQLQHPGFIPEHVTVCSYEFHMFLYLQGFLLGIHVSFDLSKTCWWTGCSKFPIDVNEHAVRLLAHIHTRSSFRHKDAAKHFKRYVRRITSADNVVLKKHSERMKKQVFKWKEKKTIA